MLELLKKIIALVPVGHELCNAIAELLKELCGRVAAAEDTARETREMVAARSDQVGELVQRLAVLENQEKGPELAAAIKDVRLDAVEDKLARLVAELEAIGSDPDVRFVRADLGTPPPPVVAAADGPPAELAPPCPKHPDAKITPNGCTAEGCIWPGIDTAA